MQLRSIRNYCHIWAPLFLLLCVSQFHKNDVEAKMQKLKVMKKLFKAKIFLKPLIKSGAIRAPMLHLIMPLMMQSTLNRFAAAAGAGSSGLSGIDVSSSETNTAGGGIRLGSKRWPILGKSLPTSSSNGQVDTSGSMASLAPMANSIIQNNAANVQAMYGRFMKGLNHGASRLQYMFNCHGKSHNRPVHLKRSIGSCIPIQCRTPHECHLVSPEIDTELTVNPTDVLQMSFENSGTTNHLDFGNEPIIASEEPEVIAPVVHNYNQNVPAIREHNPYPQQNDYLREAVGEDHYYHNHHQQHNHGNGPSQYYHYDAHYNDHHNHRKLLEQTKPTVSTPVPSGSVPVPLQSSSSASRHYEP